MEMELCYNKSEYNAIIGCMDSLSIQSGWHVMQIAFEHIVFINEI